MNNPENKYLFIDIDGVLISDNDNDLGDFALNNLLYIVNETGAKLILSSTWRLHDKTLNYIRDKFNRYGLVLYSTTIRNTKLHNRTQEILQWINENKCGKFKWMAIDDSELNLSEKNYLQIDPEYGLTDDDAKIIVANLSHHKT